MDLLQRLSTVSFIVFIVMFFFQETNQVLEILMRLVQEINPHIHWRIHLFKPWNLQDKSMWIEILLQNFSQNPLNPRGSYIVPTCTRFFLYIIGESKMKMYGLKRLRTQIRRKQHTIYNGFLKLRCTLGCTSQNIRIRLLRDSVQPRSNNSLYPY